MPGILFRHIFIELIKVLVVTTAVLVTVIAFGAAIKPLTENLLKPADLLRFMLYATVPMLQFALPFAGAFAGVIVYHRLSVDNEVVAMSASGIPYRRVLLPAVVLGIILTGCMLVLVDVGVPRFWRALKDLAAEDVTRGFVKMIERGEAKSVGSTEIYADEAYVEEAPSDSGATQRLRLSGVVVLELVRQPDGLWLPHREITARYATTDLHRSGRNLYLKPALQDATVFTHGDRAIASSAIARPGAIDLGRLVQRGPKGLTFVELLALREHLERDDEVTELRAALIAALSVVDAWQSIDEALQRGASIELSSGGQDELWRYEIRAAGLRGTELFGTVAVPVTVRQLASDGRERSTINAARMSVAVSASPGEQPRVELISDDAVVHDPRAPNSTGVRRPIRLSDLVLAQTTTDRSNDSIDQLLASADSHGRSVAAGLPVGSKGVDIAAAGLQSRLKIVSDEIVARIVQRLSQAMTAILMLVSASILSVWLREKPPLVVYVLAFVPAIADIMLVSSGEQMLRRDVTMWGIIVGFSGNAILLGVSVFGAWRVGRH